MKKLTDLALAIASEKHDGQTDKSGMPYIGHVVRVAERCQSPTAKIVALLHDIIEDTDVTADYLREKGIPDDIVACVLIMTRRDGESYEDYIRRVAANPVCREVKISDLEDNMDIRRLTDLTDYDFQRLRKYLKAWHFLRVLS